MYRYTTFIQFPIEYDWSKWAKAQKKKWKLLDFCHFLGAYDTDLKIVSGTPITYCVTFMHREKKLEFFRHAFLKAFPKLTFKNWSVTHEKKKPDDGWDVE